MNAARDDRSKAREAARDKAKGDERIGVDIVLGALSAPLKTIVVTLPEDTHTVYYWIVPPPGNARERGGQIGLTPHPGESAAAVGREPFGLHPSGHGQHDRAPGGRGRERRAEQRQETIEEAVVLDEIARHHRIGHGSGE